MEQKLNNEREEFNKQYLHAIELIIDAGKIDRASFHALESDKKLELLLNLTPEQLEKLPIDERQNLQLQEKINGLRKRHKSNYMQLRPIT
ncbi:hypothetical protein [Candidatus Chromulinivorax destructor]|uniref:Uncharacterized protein n=1 Tax=Candidatus Chromulinivorax destructor TaxID=2066483 RepID=A0A345ZC41_9BACT|nr:hypothetical protein [Candidatus Chromulinivorax destructor]AXK60858.1 hypothetical protein C0J27_03885 [Candidatus Chromulinivorax destructor]